LKNKLRLSVELTITIDNCDRCSFGGRWGCKHPNTLEKRLPESKYDDIGRYVPISKWCPLIKPNKQPTNRDNLPDF
jgi:hypothetical protein